MNKIKRSAVLALIALLAIVLPVSAAVFPQVITLPVGFRPEGIAVGRGSTFFTGSLADGSDPERRSAHRRVQRACSWPGRYAFGRDGL